MTFATEINGQTFFPVQDTRCNICALQKTDGTLAEWSRFSAFGSKDLSSNLQGISNPWQFANRREVADLTLFTHRFYNNRLMRWQTTDPLGFEDSLNLYCYVHNNPFCYKDPDGRIIFAIPLIVGAFGTTGLVISGPRVGAIAGIAVGTVLGYGVFKGLKAIENKYDNVGIGSEKDQEKNNEDRREKFKFPENPDELLPDLPRDDKGRIHPADNIRIRPEKHEMQLGETHNPRHHDQHYHVEKQRERGNGWGKRNTEKIKPSDYQNGGGTGFLPGEIFPGVI